MTRVRKPPAKPKALPKVSDASAGKATKAVRAILERMKGARAEPVPMPRGAPSPAVMYKLMGKMFAVLSVRGDSFVIVKCDPGLADMLRQTYKGIGHRSHLDPRFWISIDLEADVPLKETRKLIEASHALIYASLTRRQREELDAS